MNFACPCRGVNRRDSTLSARERPGKTSAAMELRVLHEVRDTASTREEGDARITAGVAITYLTIKKLLD